MSSVIEVSSEEQFHQLISKSGLIVIHFWASFSPQCQQINDVLIELSKDKDLDSVTFAKVEAESLAKISSKFNITSVPTCLLLISSKVVDVVEGADVVLLTKKIKQASFKVAPTLSTPNSFVALNSIEDRLKNLINRAPIMVFMKGSPEAPRCGFSRTLVSILNEINAKYDTFDILTDEEVRQELKTFSNWPTYPQVYVEGNLIGGLDIIKELKESGELEEALNINKT